MVRYRSHRAGPHFMLTLAATRLRAADVSVLAAAVFFDFSVVFCYLSGKFPSTSSVCVKRRRHMSESSCGLLCTVTGVTGPSPLLLLILAAAWEKIKPQINWSVCCVTSSYVARLHCHGVALPSPALSLMQTDDVAPSQRLFLMN